MPMAGNAASREAEILALFAEWRKRRLWGTVRFIMKDGLPVDVVEQANKTYHLKCAQNGADAGDGGPETHHG